MAELITTRELVVALLTLDGNVTAARIDEAAATYRRILANVSIVADLHAVGLDEPVGLVRALQVTDEAAGWIRAEGVAP